MHNIFFQHPWTALILKGDNFPERIRSLWCGGAIVTTRHIISAGHCFINKRLNVKEKFTNFDDFSKIHEPYFGTLQFKQHKKVKL